MKLATLCYIRNDDHTLMIHRVKKENDMHAGKWNGLGGKLESGETPEVVMSLARHRRLSLRESSARSLTIRIDG